MSAIITPLCRRHLLSPVAINRNSCTIYNQHARQFATKKRKPPKLGATSKKGGVAAKIKKKRPITFDDKKKDIKKKPSTQAPTPPAINYNIEKARHMQTSAVSPASNDGVFDWLAANPLIFAIVIFPVATMGVVLVFRPQIRPKFLGGPGSSTKKEEDDVIMEKEVPVYDNVDSNSNGMSSLTSKNEVADDNNLEETVSQSTENVIGSEEIKETEKAVADLFRAVGIRPHPSG